MNISKTVALLGTTILLCTTGTAYAQEDKPCTYSIRSNSSWNPQALLGPDPDGEVVGHSLRTSSYLIRTTAMKKAHNTKPEDPWSEFDSKRRTYAFGLRLTERETARMKSLAEQKGTSMHKLCVDALAQYLGEKDHAANAETMECTDEKNHKVLCPHCKGTLFEIPR